MKKILSLILAAALLFAFASFALAAVPEDELQAQGRALLEETIAIVSTRQFTIERAHDTLAVSGDNTVVIIPDFWRNAGLERFVFRPFVGTSARYLYTPNRSFIVFPERRFALWGPPERSYAPFALPTQMPDEITVTQQRMTSDGIEGWLLRVMFYEGNTSFTFEYFNGQLRRMSSNTGGIRQTTSRIISMSPTVDPSWFSTRWMIRISAVLLLFFLAGMLS